MSKITPKFSASLIGTGMCLPKHLKKGLSFTMKWPLTWGKKERMFLINQFYLDSSWTSLWKQATSISSTLKDIMTFSVKSLQKESKSLWKSLKTCVKIQTKLISFTWRENWTAFQKSALLVKVLWKYLRVLSFFLFYSISPLYTTNSGIFNVVFLIKFQIHLNKTSKFYSKNCVKFVFYNRINCSLALENRQQNWAFSW